VDSIRPVASNRAALPRSQALHQWLRNTSNFKEHLKKFIPFSVRHRLKMFAIDSNLRPFDTPPLDEGIAQSLRQQYAGEMKKLEQIIDRDLSAWYRGN
jgi:hypothetical protein